MEISSSQPGRQTQPGSVLSVSSCSSRTVRQAGPRRWGRSCRGLQAAARSTAALQHHARTCSTPPHVPATQNWDLGEEDCKRIFHQPSLVPAKCYSLRCGRVQAAGRLLAGWCASIRSCVCSVRQVAGPGPGPAPSCNSHCSSIDQNKEHSHCHYTR